MIDGHFEAESFWEFVARRIKLLARKQTKHATKPRARAAAAR